MVVKKGKKTMNSNPAHPKTITVIIAMLVLLALISTATSLTGRLLFRAPNRQFNQGQTNNGAPGGGNLPGGGGNFQGGGGGNFQGGFPGGARGGIGGLNLFGVTRSLGLNGPWVIYLSLGFTILGILLLLVSAYAVWKSKIWGLNLALVLGILFLVGALPGLFSIGGRNPNWLRLGLNILSLVATLPVVGLSLLPSVRDYFPRPAPAPRK